MQPVEVFVRFQTQRSEFPVGQYPDRDCGPHMHADISIARRVLGAHIELDVTAVFPVDAVCAPEFNRAAAVWAPIICHAARAACALAFL
jgi:hypothetical protein